jgi:hypothetical protein
VDTDTDADTEVPDSGGDSDTDTDADTDTDTDSDSDTDTDTDSDGDTEVPDDEYCGYWDGLSESPVWHYRLCEGSVYITDWDSFSEYATCTHITGSLYIEETTVGGAGFFAVCIDGVNGLQVQNNGSGFAGVSASRLRRVSRIHIASNSGMTGLSIGDADYLEYPSFLEEMPGETEVTITSNPLLATCDAVEIFERAQGVAGEVDEVNLLDNLADDCTDEAIAYSAEF